MPKHFFFDLDNTLTRSRNHIDPSHAIILNKLADVADVIVATGGQQSQIMKQLDPEVAGRYYILAQNGNHAVTPSGTTLWQRTLSPDQKQAVIALFEKMKAHLAISVSDPSDLIEDRGSSICYSIIGHHEQIEKKEAFDPDHKIRTQLLELFKSDVDTLRTTYSVEIRSGGTTTLDCFEAGKNKGFNVRELNATLGWKPEECLYVGDALFPGGNDETVIGIIPTKAVANFHETYEYLSEVLR